MKKDPSSSRSINYFIRNCITFRNCRNFVLKLLKFYEIENYEIREHENGTDVLWIVLNNIEYKIEFDIKNVCLKVTSSVDNHQHYTRYTDADCYHQVLKYILKKER